MTIIVADTTCGLPHELLAHRGVPLIPQTVIFSETPFHDDKELDTAAFLQKLKASAKLPKTAAPEAVIAALSAYRAPASARGLPSTPDPVILVHAEADRPQPRLDRFTGKGMSTVVGRVRLDPLLHIKLVVLSHNTIRGAAGGSIYNAELLVSEKLL